MKTSVLNIKIDPKTKGEAQKIADKLGFSLSAIVNASLKNLIRSKSVSYSLFEPTPFLKDAIKSARADRTKGQNYGPFSPKEAVSFLRSV